MFEKKCKICDCVFTGSGPAAKYCVLCKESVLEETRAKARAATQAYRIRMGLVKKPGVGKGGNPLIASEHQNFRHGYYIADRLRAGVKSRRYCERCNLDLQDADRWHWVVHHRDHNHCNNVTENLELLCKRCHQIEHECHKAFTKGATTRA